LVAIQATRRRQAKTARFVEQARILRALRCEEMQDYLSSRQSRHVQPSLMLERR
jgi:hypothetical protein